jgi:peptide/nickel transport system substrate-binding protein
MVQFKRIGPAASAGVALALVLAACGGSSSNDTDNAGGGTGSEGVKGGTVTVYHASDFEHLDPARSFVTDSSTVGALVYRSLTSYKWNAQEKKAELVGDLAESWTPSADFKTWTFKLKPGLKYEDASVITAKDIKYNVERSFSADLPEGAPYGHQYLDCKGYAGPYTPAGNNGGKGCTAITVPDDNTIEFKLNQPVPEFNHTASMKIFSPTPQAKDTKTQYDSRPFSSGPYKIEKYVRDQSLTLVRNTNWDGASDPVRTALPDKWEFKFGDDESTVDQRLIANGTADQASITFSPIQPQNLGKLSQASVKDRVVEGPDICVRYIGYNYQKPFLKDQKFREALTYGLDRKAYITARGGERVNKIVNSMVPSSLEGFRESKQFERADEGDVTKAKELLGQTSYKGEKLVLGASDATDISIKAAEAAQAAWKRIGVNVEIRKIIGKNYYSTQQNDASATDLITASWCYDWSSLSTIVPPVLGPDSSAAGKAAQNNYSRFNDQPSWDKMTEIANMSDQKAAATAWADLYDKIMEQAPLVPISQDNNVYVIGSNIANASVDADKGGLLDIAHIGVKKVS